MKYWDNLPEELKQTIVEVGLALLFGGIVIAGVFV